LRRNVRLVRAYERFPQDTWTYEALAKLRPGCSREELEALEQIYIERLHSWQPQRGFNMNPASWRVNSEFVAHARKRLAARLAADLQKQRERWARTMKSVREEPMARVVRKV
jgi:hypothetical protein